MRVGFRIHLQKGVNKVPYEGYRIELETLLDFGSSGGKTWKYVYGEITVAREYGGTRLMKAYFLFLAYMD